MGQEKVAGKLISLAQHKSTKSHTILSKRKNLKTPDDIKVNAELGSSFLFAQSLSLLAKISEEKDIDFRRKSCKNEANFRVEL